MIICICKKVNEQEIKEQLSKHQGCVKEVIKETGACTQCKKCAKEISNLKQEYTCCTFD